jgi:hypothetical protein
MICPTGEAKYFCKRDSTGKLQRRPTGKSLEPAGSNTISPSCSSDAQFRDGALPSNATGVHEQRTACVRQVMPRREPVSAQPQLSRLKVLLEPRFEKTTPLLGRADVLSPDHLSAVPRDRRSSKPIRQRPSLDCPTTSDYPERASSLHSIQSCMRSPQVHVRAMTDQARQSSIDEFQCARCGAVYDVAITHRAPRAEYDAVCIVCCEVMNEWHGTVGRAYTLKLQPAHA